MKTNDQFLKELQASNVDVIPLEKYKGRHTKILVKDSLGIEYLSSPQMLKYNPTIRVAVNKSIAFSVKCSIVHNNKYDYSLVKYNNNTKKVKIICPDHGMFEQIPANHLNGQGCPECAELSRTDKKRGSLEDFVKRSNVIHGDKYDYSKSIYIKSSIKVCIICLEHGEFFQVPNSHIAGQGCPKCGHEKMSNLSRSSNEEFIEKANIIHNFKYNYSLVEYLRSNDKVKIICNKHGEFEQRPSSHLKGSACPECGLYGFKKSKWIELSNICENSDPLIYVIRCFNDHEEFIKIGITYKPIRKRFKTRVLMPYSYEIMKEIKGSPDFVWDREKELHRLYKKYKYKPMISFGGDTECFNIELLKLLQNIV